MLSFYQKLASKLNETGSGVSDPPPAGGARSASFKATGERVDPAAGAGTPPANGDGPAGAASAGPQNDATPDGSDPLDVDLFQSDERMVIAAQLPGVPADGFSVTIDEESNTVVVEAEAKRPPLPPPPDGKDDGEKGRYIKQEIKWRKLYRKVYLPGPFDAGMAKAFLSRGILTVVLPVKRPGTGKKLAVQELPDETRERPSVQ